MDEKEYNGWKNYDTWSLSLLIDNDQGLYEEFHEKVEEFKKTHGSISEIMDWLKDWAYEWLGYEDLDSNQQQMIGSSLDNIDYRDIIMNEANIDFEDLQKW